MPALSVWLERRVTLDVVWVCLAAVAAGCVDAIAGGGGLIQTPALFTVYGAAPPATLLGTNKFAAVWGTANAAWRYTRRLSMDWQRVWPLAVMVGIASAAGAWLATRLPANLFRPLVPVLLLVLLVYVLWQRNLGSAHAPRELTRSQRCLALLSMAGIGFYDGVFGPGTGSFLMLVFVRLYGFDFLHASAHARVLNVVTNLTALTWFARQGHVWWSVASAMAVCNVLGSQLGSHLALRKGSGFVRQLFIVVVSLLIARTAWQAWMA